MPRSDLTRLTVRGLALALLVLTYAATADGEEPALERLRADFAMRYMEPDAHTALAKYYLEHGNRLMAFYILEAARRGPFEGEQFNKAFRLAFRGPDPFDNSKAAEESLLKEYARAPASFEVLTKLADIYISREDYAKAKEFLSKAISLRPEDFGQADALAEVLRRQGQEKEAEALVREYARKYPTSVDGYRIRVAELIEREPGKAKPLLEEAAGKFPDEGAFPFNLGTILQKEGNDRAAEEQFVKAAKLAPDSVYIQSWVGRFFFKVRGDNARALEYYLNAYLLDPDAYETEYVESRVRDINSDMAGSRLEQMVKAGTPLAKIVEDPNPAVVGLAVERMSKGWEPRYIDTMLELMRHDDEGVRWAATEAVMAHADKSFDATLKSLLRDADLRRRGLAAYVAVRLWQRGSFDALRAMLSEEAQLLRFDALSALVLEGGDEGRNLVAEHMPRETNPNLKRLINSALEHRRQP